MDLKLLLGGDQDQRQAPYPPKLSPAKNNPTRNKAPAVNVAARALRQVDPSGMTTLPPSNPALERQGCQYQAGAPYAVEPAPSDYVMARSNPSAVYEAVTSTPFYPRPLVLPPPPNTRRAVFVPGHLLSEKAFAQREVETQEDPPAYPAGNGDRFSGHYFADLLEAQTRVRKRSDGFAETGRSRKRLPVVPLPPDHVPLTPASRSPSQSQVGESSSRSSLSPSTGRSSVSAHTSRSSLSSSTGLSSLSSSTSAPSSAKLATLPYGLAQLPPLSTNARPLRHATLLRRQGQIIFRPRNMFHGTDIPPQAILPHLHAIRALRNQNTSERQNKSLGGSSEGRQNRRRARRQQVEEGSSMPPPSSFQQSSQQQRLLRSSAAELQPFCGSLEQEHQTIRTSAGEQQWLARGSRVQKRQLTSSDSYSHSTPTSPADAILRVEVPEIRAPWMETLFYKPTSESSFFQPAKVNSISASIISTVNKATSGCCNQNTEPDIDPLPATRVHGSGSGIDSCLLTKTGEDQIESDDDSVQGTANCQPDRRNKDGVVQASNATFPRPDHSLGRQASQPPPFQPDAEAECMRPRFQPAKFEGDLYTPAIVRAGRSSGVGQAAGDNGSKEGWCGLCPPRSTSASSPIGGWLNLRNSSYRYHLVRVHGISPKTGLPFKEPLMTERRNGEPDVSAIEGIELRGMCHQCRMWINFRVDDATNFFVHAAKCHREASVKGMQSDSASQPFLGAHLSSSCLPASSLSGTKRRSGPLSEVGPSNTPGTTNESSMAKKTRGSQNVPSVNELNEEEKENATQRFFDQLEVRRSSRFRKHTNL